MRSLCSFVLTVCLSVLPYTLNGQGDNTLTITVEGGSAGYTFYANNISPDDYHIIITMTKMTQLRCDCILPFAGNIGPGRTELFRLRREGLSNVMSSNNDYNYLWSFMNGHANPDMKEDAVYLMPVANGAITETIELNDIQQSYGDEPTPENFYGIGFKMHSGDTIYAARDGKVTSIVDGWESRKENSLFSDKENQISITQKDKTIATYSIIRNGSFLVRERESVVAGQPLAIVGGDNYAVGPHVRFAVSYLFFDESIMGNDDYQYRYLKPEFATERHGSLQLEDKTAYKAVRPEKVLHQDLSRREIKRRKKKSKSR